MADRDIRLVIRAKDEASRILKKFTKALTSLPALAAAAGAAIAGVFTGQALRNSLDFADRIQKLNIRLGFTTQFLSEMRFAASASGTALEAIVPSLQRMVRRLSEAGKGTGVAIKALDELGISVETIASAKPDQQFEILAEALAGVENQTDKVRLAFQLFGKEGVSILQIIGDSVEGYRNLRKESAATGASFSREQVDAAADTNDAILRLQTAFQALLDFLAIEFAPVVTQAFDSFRTTVIPTLKDFATETAKSFREIDAKEAIAKLAEFAKATRDSLGSVVNVISAVRDAARLGFSSVKVGVDSVLVAYQKLFGSTSALNLANDALTQSYLDQVDLLDELLTEEDKLSGIRQQAEADIDELLKGDRERIRVLKEQIEAAIALDLQLREVRRAEAEGAVTLQQINVEAVAALQTREQAVKELKEELAELVRSGASIDTVNDKYQELQGILKTTDQIAAEAARSVAERARKEKRAVDDLIKLRRELADQERSTEEQVREIRRRGLTAAQRQRDIAREAAAARRAASAIILQATRVQSEAARKALLEEAEGEAERAARLGSRIDDVNRSARAVEAAGRLQKRILEEEIKAAEAASTGFTALADAQEKAGQDQLGGQLVDGLKAASDEIGQQASVIIETLRDIPVTVNADQAFTALDDIRDKMRELAKGVTIPITTTGAGSNLAGFAAGGRIPGGFGGGDRVHILAEPGEFMLNKMAAKALGPSLLASLNSISSNHALQHLAQPGPQRLADGGAVSVTDTVNINLNIAGSNIRLFGPRAQARQLSDSLALLSRGLAS